MESDLYINQQENFLTILKYYNKSKEKADNYYSYIEKYKECTKKYLSNIKKIYDEFSPSLYEDLLNFTEEDEIDDNIGETDDPVASKNIFDLDNNKNNIEINDINSINSVNTINTINNINITNSNSIKIDLSPIFKMTNIIFKNNKNQIKGINLFLKGLDITMDNFKNLLEQTKKEINILKDKYLDIKQNFFQSIKAYQKENTKLLSEYSKLENKITQFAFLKNNEDIFKNNKITLNIDIQTSENDLNIKVMDMKGKEKEFLKKDIDKKNFFLNYEKGSKECIKEIKHNILTIIESFQLSTYKFLSYFENSYNLNYKDLSPAIKNIQEMKIEEVYKELFKKYIKEINDNIMLSSYEKYKPNKYNIQVLKNKSINPKLFEKIIQIGNEFKEYFFDLKENDIYFIVKKMYNFDLVNKDNYDINKENKKVFINNAINELLIFKNGPNKKVDNNNNQKIQEEKISKLYKLIELDKEYRIYFLEKLGNKRSEVVLEFPNYLYNIILKIFFIISDCIAKEKDMDCTRQILILSQTFCKIENGVKIYLCHDICTRDMFKEDDFWKEYINNTISMEIERRKISEKNLERKLEESEIKIKNNEIIFAQLLTMSECMKNFELSGEKITDILIPLLDEYEINDKNKEAILNYINKK
jgi:hypothetical protein